ncbi:MAG TPA: ATP-binding protein [Leptospiraceae bacterium]|nr:ATP-binding protein [Leptospiraceae bacterium]HMW06281.1 ATP-binding protein [Leptospiraceae bacterium]HMX34606.1 ATP-binding protein [Leptospiraceae bacterium]HMY31743.1 ATP-binding protein [Leptospiraceae bacterium]HMZ64536.1 ATP-binding protein [Leptospiraceae bacterium]
MPHKSKNKSGLKKILILDKDLVSKEFLVKKILEKGYAIEEKIPFASLQFPPKLNPIDLVIVEEVDRENFLSSENYKKLKEKEIPVLFLSQNLFSMESDLIFDILLKPLREEEVVFRVERLIHISRDMSHLKKKNAEWEVDMKVQHLIENELLEKENRLATILDSVEAYIYIKDSHYRYQYANKKVRDLFGETMEDIINKDDFDFFDYPTAINIRKNDRLIIEKGQRIEEEEVNTGLNGTTNVFLSVKLPMYREDGTIYALSGISTDITKHKLAEEKLKKTLAQLEEQHTQLKATQAQLVQAEKMAGLGTLVAGVAHEVNNPTNYISLSSRALERDIDKFRKEVISLMAGSEDEIIQYFEENFSKFQKSLSNILEGSERIRTIVQDLRSFSRLDEAEKKEADLCEVLDSTLRIVKTQYKRSIKITSHYLVKRKIECYPAQLGQVFLNILINACHAILQKQIDTLEQFSGKIKLTLQENEESDELQVVIEDNGCGMSEDVLQRIFEPFFTTKLVGQGTGLGMSISYGIIQKHNGRIDVISKMHEGTTVTVSIPFIRK